MANPFLSDTMFGGGYQPGMPQLGIPGLDQNPLFGIGLQMALPALLQGQGLAALQFGGTQRLMDTLQAQHQFFQQSKAMQLAGERDQVQLRTMLTGAARMAGADDAYLARQDVQASLDRLSASGRAILPFLAMADPDLTDRSMGVRGSSFVLGQRIYKGSRFLVDPVTGGVGFSGASAAGMATGLYDQLYGPGANITAMRGIGAGEAGGMFEELGRRGIIGGQNLDPGKVSQSLKQYANAVSAMKEIFGEMGDPNAPMPKIIAGLQALTQGGLQVYDPARLGQVVRQTQEMARMAGVDMAGFYQMSARGAGLAEQNGLHRAFGFEAARDSLAFAAALRNSGMSRVTGTGAFDIDSATAYDAQLRVQASNSPVANMLAAAVAADAAEGSKGQLANVIKLIKSGDVAAIEAMNLDPAKMAKIFEDSGNSSGRFWGLYGNPRGLEEYKIGGLGRIARALQPGMDAGRTMRAQFQLQGLSDEQANNALQAFWNLSPEDLANSGTAAKAMARAIGDPSSAGALQTALGVYSQITGQSFKATAQVFNPKVLAEMERQSFVAANRAELAGTLAGVGRAGFLRNFVDYALTGSDQSSVADFVGKVLGGGVSKDKLREVLDNSGSGDAFIKGVRQYVDEASKPNADQGKLKALRDSLNIMSGDLFNAFDAKFSGGSDLSMPGGKSWWDPFDAGSRGPTAAAPTVKLDPGSSLQVTFDDAEFEFTDTGMRLKAGGQGRV